MRYKPSILGERLLLRVNTNKKLCCEREAWWQEADVFQAHFEISFHFQIDYEHGISAKPNLFDRLIHSKSPLMLKNSLYFGAHFLLQALPQMPMGTAAAMLKMTMRP